MTKHCVPYYIKIQVHSVSVHVVYGPFYCHFFHQMLIFNISGDQRFVILHAIFGITSDQKKIFAKIIKIWGELFLV